MSLAGFESSSRISVALLPGSIGASGVVSSSKSVLAGDHAIPGGAVSSTEGGVVIIVGDGGISPVSGTVASISEAAESGDTGIAGSVRGGAVAESEARAGETADSTEPVLLETSMAGLVALGARELLRSSVAVRLLVEIVELGVVTVRSSVLHLYYYNCCLLYTSPSPRDATLSRMPSSA